MNTMVNRWRHIRTPYSWSKCPEAKCGFETVKGRLLSTQRKKNDSWPLPIGSVGQHPNTTHLAKTNCQLRILYLVKTPDNF